MTTALLEQTTRQEVWDGAVIDVDVHANIPQIEALFPYLDELWVDWITERAWRGPVMPNHHYPVASERAARLEWRPEGAGPATSVGLLQEHILDPWNVDNAIVNCYYGIEGLRHPDWAAALASAVNDWLIDQWLSKDDRLRATMVMPARDTAAMIKEIRRVGDHPGFVQAFFPTRSDNLWGQRQYHGVFRELAARDLVVGLHYGGTTEGAPSSTGYANYYVEQYGAEWQSFATQVTSLISEGVFTDIPALRVSVLEGGFLWFPVWGWRMNKEWKGLRREVPWLDRPPLHIMRDHFRFSTAPIDAGPPELMAKALQWIGNDDMLMFATDYPHRHDDDIAGFLSLLSAEARAKVMAENAREWYRL
ncbi:amidohydrolase family protein [Microbacterium lacus]|uniref:Amidohydrolase family protein n=1 Tax=Microbacterium lacus TaxID=415217 RepID=A0ABN2H039_9MICO